MSYQNHIIIQYIGAASPPFHQSELHMYDTAWVNMKVKLCLGIIQKDHPNCSLTWTLRCGWSYIWQQSGTDLIVSYSTARHQATPQQKSFISFCSVVSRSSFSRGAVWQGYSVHRWKNTSGKCSQLPLKSLFHITRQQLAVVAPSFSLETMQQLWELWLQVCRVYSLGSKRNGSNQNVHIYNICPYPEWLKLISFKQLNKWGLRAFSRAQQCGLVVLEFIPSRGILHLFIPSCFNLCQALLKVSFFLHLLDQNLLD